jgi:hypothetical protein
MKKLNANLSWLKLTSLKSAALALTIFSLFLTWTIESLAKEFLKLA